MSEKDIGINGFVPLNRNTNLSDIAMTLCNDTITRSKDLSGHKHSKLYSPDGLSFITKESVYNLKFGRAASVIVCSVNSSDEIKRSADYVCDGINDQNMINDAIDTAYALSLVNIKGRGTVLLLSGQYVIKSSINIKSGVSLIGQHGLYGVTLNGSSGIDVINFTVTEANMGGVDISYMTILGGGRAIHLTADVIGAGYVPMDICLDRVMGMNQTIESFRLGGYISGVGTSPVWGLRMTRCLAEYCAGNGDTTGHGFFVCASQAYIDKCFAANNHGDGFRIIGSGCVQLQQSQSWSSDRNGIMFDCSEGTVNGCIIKGWNLDKVTPTVDPGSMAINAVGSDRATITNNVMINANDATDYQNNGIWVSPLTSIMTNNVFYGTAGHFINYAFYQSSPAAEAVIFCNSQNNYVRYLASGALLTSSKIGFNKGLYATTENSGEFTIVAGQTYVDVTHGLSRQPLRVLLSFNTDTGGKRVWVSSKDQGGSHTLFRITIDSAHSSDIVGDWRATRCDGI